VPQQNRLPKPNRRARKHNDKNKSHLPGGNLPLIGGKAHIETTWRDIKWTRKKLFLIIFLLGLPYLMTIIATYLAGLTMVTFVLIGLALLVGILFLIVRWVENADF
jgi:hypothetical protein